MPEAATTEFWNWLKLTAQVFEPDALDDIHICDMAAGDIGDFVFKQAYRCFRE